jgi:hypothetical protein
MHKFFGKWADYLNFGRPAGLFASGSLISAGLLTYLLCLADGYLLLAAQCGHPSSQPPRNDGVQQAAPRVHAHKVV